MTAGISVALLVLLGSCSDRRPQRAPGAVGEDASGGVSTATPAGAACGEERWSVKTLSDERAGNVNFNPERVPVDHLRALAEPKPAVKNTTKRLSPVETTTFTVEAALVAFKLEDDRDVHLIIADPANLDHTMIVELPDVACEGAIASSRRVEIEAARAAFVAACGEPVESFRLLGGHATITGVGFFDRKHGQRGLAPNGIELHPVLAFSSSDCAPAGGAPRTPSPVPTAQPAATPGTESPVAGG